MKAIVGGGKQILSSALFIIGVLALSTPAYASVNVNPSSINFGSVTVGAVSTSAYVTLSNNGTWNAKFTGVSLSSTQFSYVGPTGSFTLKAYQSLRVAVSFRPTAAQSYSGTLTFTRTNGSRINIPLAGTGIDIGTQAPTITGQPASSTVIAGQTATFAVVASGTAPLSYQWSKNGAVISGATSHSYAAPATVTSDSGAQFTVVVANSAGSVTSSSATLTVNAAAVAPSIATQPSSQTVTAAQTATFSVAATGTAPLSYQWRKNGVNLSGATSSSYTTPATTTADSGARFDVQVGNSIGAVASSAATLTVSSTQTSFTPIRINSAGGAYTDSQGHVWSADASFSGGTAANSTNAIANTVDDVLYQSERWGPSTYTFTVPTGSYLVTLKFAETVYNSSGQRIFNVAINGTTVLANFDIVAAAGGANTAVDQTFAVNAGSGSNNLQIQFIHVSGQPDDPKVDAIDIESGTTTPIAPNITTQPVSSTVVAGQTATFSVAATGTAPLAYQWRKNGANIGGATSSSYTTPATTATDSGAQFTVVVANSVGSVTSIAAVLTVNSASIAPSITTQPASRTVTAGQTASFSLSASGTSPFTYQWNKNGAAISGATSSTYTTPATATSDSGAQFTVVVTNAVGSITSNAAVLTVNAGTLLLTVNPTSLSFGNVNLSASATKSATITNSGTASVTISGVSYSGAGFTTSGLSSGLILSPGQAAVLNVNFNPTTTGSVSGSIAIASNATNSPASLAISGTGVQLITHNAILSWIPSTSTVTGYQVYSSIVSGGPYTKLTATAVNQSSYTDSTVQSGNTYYYVVTAVDSSSVASAYSNQAVAVIP